MPTDSEKETFHTRPDEPASTLPDELATAFLLKKQDASYKHQYANLYFVRLAQLRKHTIARAKERWKDTTGNPKYLPRILEVSKGQLSWIVGTVYKEMPLKDNVLDDLAKEHGIAPPPPRLKFYSELDQVILEDESGRIMLVGDALPSFPLVTGVIAAFLGVETTSGDFQVIDVCFPGAAPQSNALSAEHNGSMEIDSKNEWIACVSGLNIGSPSAAADLKINLLVEYLLGETGDSSDQLDASSVSRVIIAGNSFAPFKEDDPDDPKEDAVMVPGEHTDVSAKKAQRKYGYESSAFSTHPTQSLSGHLSELSRAMIVHLLPGDTDPAGITLPQQPLPRAMFGTAKDYDSFRTETNPCWIGVGNCHLLATGGQPLNDIFRYVKSSDRLALACEMLKWRHMAPTAPDTLWCFPYFLSDPFIMSQTPHIYIIGNQPRFETTVVNHEDGQRTRVVLIPRFHENGELVLINPVTLQVKCVRIDCQWE